MRLSYPRFLALICVGLMACTPDVTPETVSAPPQDISVARQAAGICARHLPDIDAAHAAFIASGYSESTQPTLTAQRGGRFLSPGDDSALVLLARQGRESICYVGAPGLSPQQAHDLAQPIVAKVGAKTNAERGQGLSRKLVQAWAA